MLHAAQHLRLLATRRSVIPRIARQSVALVRMSADSHASAAAAGTDAAASALVEPNYRPHALSSEALGDCWVQKLELDSAMHFGQTAISQQGSSPPRILVLYGSLRERSFSRLLAYEFARVLELLGAEVRVYNPAGLPMKDGVSEKHPKVVEIRELSQWSEGQMWVCPEQHGTITAVFKNQIDWVPLELGSVRPTQGRTLAIAQVNGGSQSFNVVNTLRVLGRWMRMFTIPNQSSVPKAWLEFDSSDRMKPSSMRDRVVDVAEELFKFTLLLRPHTDFLVDRYSEREEKRAKGRLQSQAEKEAEKAAAEKAAAASAAPAATANDS